jgi:uncharacterized protein YjbI with pentapeptide repeats
MAAKVSPQTTIVDLNNNTFELGPRADLRGMRLSGLNFSNLDLTGADLRGADLNAISLEDVNFTEVDASDASFSHCIFHECRAQRASWARCEMPLTTIFGSSFLDVDFTDADLHGLKIGPSDFSNTKFVRANLQQARIKSSRLALTSFKGALLRDAAIASDSLANIDFSAATLSGCAWLSQDGARPPAGYREASSGLLEIDLFALRAFAKENSIDVDLAVMFYHEHQDNPIEVVHDLMRRFAKVPV